VAGDDGAADVLLGLTRVEDVGLCCTLMTDHAQDVPLLELALSTLRSISNQPGAPARMAPCLEAVVAAVRGHRQEPVLQVRGGTT
jgi:hypothetical protein